MKKNQGIKKQKKLKKKILKVKNKKLTLYLLQMITMKKKSDKFKKKFF